MSTTFFLLVIIFMGFIIQSRVILLAGFTLLLLNELKIEASLAFLSNKGIEIGLIFLLLAIMAPLTLRPIDWHELKNTLTGWQGLIGILAGLLATKFNSMGLQLLKETPQLIIGIILGSMVGIVFLGGIPVGPLMAAAIAAILAKICKLFIG